jgi:hypothetical protein
MTLSGLNWLSYLVAVLFTFASGSIWFGPKTFYPIWMKAMKIDRVEHPESSSMGKVFGGLITGVLLQVLVVAWIINSLMNMNADFGILDSAVVGFWLGVAICSMPNLSHRLFAGHGYKVWIIENGNDILNFTVVAMIIAAMN